VTYTVDSETGTLKEVLVCPPTYFEWLPVNTSGLRSLASGASIDRDVVVAQHGELVDALRQSGATVRELEPQPHLKYMVYTRDSSIVTPWGPVVTQMRKPQRWGEFAYLAEFYESLDSPVWRYITHGSVEGGDVSVVRPGLLVVGRSDVRTDADGARQLCSWFEDEGWETYVLPFDDHFCHLDLIFGMVSESLALCLVDVVPSDFLQMLDRHGIEVIPITYAQAMGLGANVLALGEDRVVSPAENVAVNELLRAHGITVLDPHLGQILMGGGSAHCTTMPLVRE
jgi:N-dimethylarginine dimethylaminohydrolase